MQHDYMKTIIYALKAWVSEELAPLRQNNQITQETDPTVPEWAKTPEKPSYTASEVGADSAGTAVTAVSNHNVDSAAHNDIRLLISGLSSRLNALADSDDTTLDQMSELVAYIKDNRDLIEQITTGKVGVSDIIDNLTTNVSNKPLSAAQGVALKALIDALTTTVSGKAPTSHGNHVPATQTADNATFLRNDNTWQKVTPAGIGLKTETWTFTLEDGSTVTKAVYVG